MYGDVVDPMKMYCGKDCVEKFLGNFDNEVKQLYATFPQEPMAELMCWTKSIK